MACGRRTHLCLRLDDARHLRLNEGDSIQFDSMTPHAYIAVSDEDPVVLMSNTISPEQLSDFDAA